MLTATVFRRAKNRKHAQDARRRKKATIDSMQHELFQLRHQKQVWEKAKAQPAKVSIAYIS
jgi:hypothetical protein